MIHLLLNTKKFIPKEFHNDFFDIDFKKLYNKGYRLILTDLDNTLISYDDEKPTDKILNKLKELTNMGFEVLIISNNMPSRINVFLEGTDYKGRGNAHKPLLTGLKKTLKLAKNNYTSDQIIFVGDQLMTDIYCANRYKAYSILVNPILRKTEKWYTKLNRKIEEKMILKIKKYYRDEYLNLALDKRV